MKGGWRGAARGEDMSRPRWPALIEYPVVALLALAVFALIWAILAPVGQGDLHTDPVAADIPGPGTTAVDPFHRLGHDGGLPNGA